MGRALAELIKGTRAEARLRVTEAQTSAEAAIMANPLAACAIFLGIGF